MPVVFQTFLVKKATCVKQPNCGAFDERQFVSDENTELLTEAENELWVEYEKKGYDSWIELWCLEGCSPRAGACPARYLKADSIERRAFIRGWSKADKEHKGD